MAGLELRGVSVRYGASKVLDDVSLAVEDGELVALLGPSGCGKSTLLRVVAGLLPPAAGEVWIGGRRADALEPRERDVALVFQSYALYPHMTVRGNLAFPLRMRGVAREEIRRRVQATAEVLGLAPLFERRPGELSGGQMQRVALGRALVRQPRLFLFDEPLSNLDARLRGEMRAEIARLHRELGITTLYVTHDQAEAMTLGSRVAVLEGGRLVQVGRPLEVFGRPATAFVATFVGSPPMNLLRGSLVRDGAREGRFELGALSLACPAPGAGELVLGIRPHEIELARVAGEGEPAPGARADLVLELSQVEELGSATIGHGEVGGQPLAFAREGALPLRRGQKVAVRFPSRALHWFDARTGARVAGD